MQGSLFNIFIGVLSGVATSAILFIFYKLHVYVFNPWLENRLYRGVILEGTWTGTIHDQKIKMELTQKGYKITGIFTANQHKDETKNDMPSSLYKLNGHIVDNFVVLEYAPFSRKRTGLGTFVLEVKKRGKNMHGSSSLVEVHNMEVATISNIDLIRVDDEI